MHITRLHIILAALLTCLCQAAGLHAKQWTVENVPNFQLQDSTRLVINPDGILSPETEARLNTLLRDIRSKSTAEPVVMVLGDIDSDDIDDFATRIFEDWGIGQDDRDNGLLILLVRDKRKYVIRTGYGVEGILPDAALARLTRHKLIPALKKGDYEGGLFAVTGDIHDAMTTPEAIAELRSAHPGQHRGHDDDDLTFAGFMAMYLAFSAVALLVLCIWAAAAYGSARKGSRQEKYLATATVDKVAKYSSIFLLGLPLLLWLPLSRRRHAWRYGKHVCPNCGATMNMVDEVHDNDYLTPAQDMEEKINSVDYDVWVCPDCGETDIYAYSNPDSTYTECPKCHAKAMRMTRDRIVQAPTSTRTGHGVREFTCLNCNHTVPFTYTIAKTAPTVIIGPGIGRGGGGFGGGGGGGGFGGGSTGGGGVSGGW